MDTQWIPLLFLFLERFIRLRRPHNAALAGVFCAATALSSWYYGLSLALLLPIYLIVRVRGVWRESSRWVWLQGGAAFGVACGMLVLPFLLPYLGVFQAGESVVPLEQAAFWSASVTDYLTPNPRHFLWGEWVQRHLVAFPERMPYEFLLGWGFSTTVLALYGWRRGRTIVGSGWGWWILVALVLSLGPVFKLFGRVVELPVRPGVSQVVNGALDWLSRHSLAGEPYAFARSARIAIPLPALVLRWFVPGLTGIRGWGRFAIFATFGVVVLASAGLTSLLNRIGVGSAKVLNARRSAWLVGTSAAVIFEFYTGPQALITAGPRPVDLWLADLDERVTIIQMPLAVGLSGPQMFYSMYHGQRTATGYGTYLPVLFEERYPELQAFPSDAAIDVLTGWEGGGIALVLLDEGDVPALDPMWHEIERQDRLELMVVVDHVRVYRLR